MLTQAVAGAAANSCILSHNLGEPTRDASPRAASPRPILDSNARDLQSLEANVVVNITAFYTYMKAVRDSGRKLAAARQKTQWHEAMCNLIYMLYLALESGRNAMDDLVEFEPTHTERTMVILFSELAAYDFLRSKFPMTGELHYERLILRGPEYRRRVETLRRLLKCQEERLPSAMQDQSYATKQWRAAIQLLPMLNERFEALNHRFPLDCAVFDGRVTAIRSAS
jgi:hypothetical protein